MNDKELKKYIYDMMHTCLQNGKPDTHYIKDCKESKKYVEKFIAEYRNGRWHPSKFNPTTKYDA